MSAPVSRVAGTLARTACPAAEALAARTVAGLTVDTRYPAGELTAADRAVILAAEILADSVTSDPTAPTFDTVTRRNLAALVDAVARRDEARHAQTGGTDR